MISPELLRRYPYFSLGGDDALKSIALMSEEVHIIAGQTLFEEEDAADTLYVVVGGEVAVVQVLADDREVEVDSAVAGDLVGWSAITDNRLRRAKVVALRDSRLIAIDAVGLRELCAETPELGYSVLRGVVQTIERRLAGARVRLAACDAD